jgi:hypothetical protein
MHYRNGKEAHVGDTVIGKVYNTPGIVVGQMVSINPDTNTCNCTVAMIGKTDYSQCDNLYLAEDAYDAVEAQRPPDTQTTIGAV